MSDTEALNLIEHYHWSLSYQHGEWVCGTIVTEGRGNTARQAVIECLTTLALQSAAKTDDAVMSQLT